MPVFSFRVVGVLGLVSVAGMGSARMRWGGNERRVRLDVETPFASPNAPERPSTLHSPIRLGATNPMTPPSHPCKYGIVTKVGVFISWSGNSQGIANALYEWLPTALHSVNPWVSDYDIHKGTRFLEEIDKALTQCKAGIICLTPENVDSLWVAFEAGALASRVTSSKLVVPLVSRMRPTDVPGPLGMFQASQLC